MSVVVVIPDPGEPDPAGLLTAEEVARFNAELAADSAALEAAGLLAPPGDLCDPDDPDGPAWIGEDDLYDPAAPMSRVDQLEWELWAGIDQDEAEWDLLRREAPAWVFLPPGGALAAELEATRPSAMSPIALIELVKAATRLGGWAEAIKVEAVASFYRQRRAEHAESPRPTQIDTSGRPIDPERSWHAELALALGVTKETITRRVTTALRLTSTLQATQTALKCGALTWGKALAICEATADLPDHTARAVEAHVLKRAASQTHKNLLGSLRRQVARHTTAKDADAHRAAATERTCKIVPLPDGMAGLWIVHTADKIEQIWVTIQAIATLAKRSTPASSTPAGSSATGSTGTNPGDTTPAEPAIDPPAGPSPDTPTAEPVNDDAPPEPVTDDRAGGRVRDERAAEPVKDDPTGERVRDGRTAEQRRADVAADLFEHILRNGLDWLNRRLPDQHRRRPHIEVLIPATTLLGLDNNPCELTGYGPIPADLARRIAADGTWRRLLTDPTNGHILEATTTRHDPSPLITETLLARHPVCAWPGCNHTSRDCDRDHTTPFTQTHTTNLTGLAPYCEYHHVIKDTPQWGWTTTSHPNGTITLTTPTGHRHTTTPPARGPITQPPHPHHAPPDDPPPF